MKKLLLVITTILVLILSISSCTPSPTPTPAPLPVPAPTLVPAPVPVEPAPAPPPVPTKDNVNTYTDDTIGYSFNYLSSFQLSDADGGISLLAPDIEDMFLISMNPLDRNDEPITIESIVELTREDMSRTGLVLSDTQSGSIDGAEVRVFEGEKFSRDGQLVQTTKVALIKSDQKFGQILLVAAPPNYSEYMECFDVVVSSIKVWPGKEYVAMEFVFQLDFSSYTSDDQDKITWSIGNIIRKRLNDLNILGFSVYILEDGKIQANIVCFSDIEEVENLITSDPELPVPLITLSSEVK